jgi:hypothetical protein
LATTAYLDNFKFIEKPIGKVLAEKGEQLLRVQLRNQISEKAPISDIKQTFGETNILLDNAQKSLSH